MSDVVRPDALSLRITIRTLGQFDIVVDGRSLSPKELAQRKPLALVRLLAAAGKPGVRVDSLVDALWPEDEGDHGRNAFRVALHRLRKLIGADAVVLADSGIRLNFEVCHVDAEEFLGLLGAMSSVTGNGSTAQQVKQLADAILGLYQGPFLAGEESLPAILAVRSSLHDRFLSGILALGQALRRESAFTDAIEICQRALSIDGASEPLYGELMECHIGNGDTSEAMRAYRRCEAMLGRVLHAAPSPRLQERYGELVRLAPVYGEPPPVQAQAPASEPIPAGKPSRGDEPANPQAPPPPGAPPRPRRDFGLTRRSLLRAGGLAALTLIPAGAAAYYLAREPDWRSDPAAFLERDGFPRYRQPSIAILALEPVRNLPAERALAAGFMDRLFATLGKFPDLTIAARATVAALSDKRLPTRQLGRELGVAYLVDGSLERVDSQIRLTIRLNNAATGILLWAGSFQVPERDFRQMPEEIVVTVAKKVAQLTCYGMRSFVADEPFSGGAAAWHAYIDARFVRRLDPRNRVPSALARYEALRQRYPDNPDILMMAALTRMDVARYRWSGVSAELWVAARNDAERVNALDPERARGRVVLAYYYSYLASPIRAKAEIEAFMRYRSDDPWSHRAYAEILLFQGQTDDALMEIKRAAAMAPAYDTNLFGILQLAYFLLRRYRHAAAASQVALQRDDQIFRSWAILAASHAALGDPRRARAAAQQLRLLDPQLTARAYVATTFALFTDAWPKEELIQRLVEAGVPD